MVYTARYGLQTDQSWRTYQCNMTYVVPDIRHGLVRCKCQGTFKTVERHVILLGVETAQAQIIEQL